MSPGTGPDPAQEEAGPAVLSSSAFPGAEGRAGEEGFPHTVGAAFYLAKYVASAAAEMLVLRWDIAATSEVLRKHLWLMGCNVYC